MDNVRFLLSVHQHVISTYHMAMCHFYSPTSVLYRLHSIEPNVLYVNTTVAVVLMRLAKCMTAG